MNRTGPIPDYLQIPVRNFGKFFDSLFSSEGGLLAHGERGKVIDWLEAQHRPTANSVYCGDVGEVLSVRDYLDRYTETKLYQLKRVEISTGLTTIIYKRANAYTISRFMMMYVDEDHTVNISRHLSKKSTDDQLT